MPDARLTQDPSAAAEARRAVEDWLRDVLDRDRLEDVKLLVSELVTNAIRHPQDAGRILLRVTLGNGCVRVVVSDPGAGFHQPRVHEPPDDSPGGRGLLIVDRVASRWGVTPGRRTAVWFELDR